MCALRSFRAWQLGVCSQEGSPPGEIGVYCLPNRKSRHPMYSCLAKKKATFSLIPFLRTPWFAKKEWRLGWLLYWIQYKGITTGSEYPFQFSEKLKIVDPEDFFVVDVGGKRGKARLLASANPGPHGQSMRFWWNACLPIWKW